MTILWISVTLKNGGMIINVCSPADCDCLWD